MRKVPRVNHSVRQKSRRTASLDRVNQARLALPWVKLEKRYVFEGPDGQVSLDDLFGGKS